MIDELHKYHIAVYLDVVLNHKAGGDFTTTMGWISNHAAEWAIRMAAVLALINTAALIYFGGWPFALVGVAP